MKLQKIHHIAIICSNYSTSKEFYTEVLGLEVLAETYREERQSYKLDLALNGNYIIELFSFPDTPARVSYPEACGLRHLAFQVPDLDEAIAELHGKGVKTEEIRRDSQTGKRMVFLWDPDQLPLELCEA
jgi:glyoxylase I family protein